MDNASTFGLVSMAITDIIWYMTDILWYMNSNVAI